MMKIVYILNGVVREIISDNATPPAQWYGPEFAANCLEAPDEVEQGWEYADGMFAPPADGPTVEEQIVALKAQLEATDYQAIKYAEGQISEEEYAPIKAQRQEWRDEINRLEVQYASN